MNAKIACKSVLESIALVLSASTVACVATAASAEEAKPAVGGLAIVPLQINAKLKASPVPKALAVPGKPVPSTSASRVLFRSEDGMLESGLFEAGAGALAMRDYPRDEIDYVVSGKLAMFDASTGRTTVFKAGDHFATPRGFNGVWESHGPVKVLFIVTPVRPITK